MSGFKDVMKNGWHPKGKDGGKESWRGDNKGINTVAGWMGKGKDPNEAARNHQSAPLSTLKDPSSFGPPPKHVAAHGGVPSTTSPTTRITLREQREAQRKAEEEANKPPPGPYRADTTGLDTAHLPKPPAFRPGQASSTPVDAPKPKPKLPPRLPPRQNSHPDSFSTPPPPSYNEATQDTTTTTAASPQSYVNQGALGRLGQAGVSVPGLNIGRDTPPVPPPPRQTASPYASPTSPPPPAESSRGPQLGELQSRFAKMTTSSSTGGQAPATGTSWADKQAALKTAGNLRDDPSKVSASDVQSAASTANNFRERHGEQVATGWKAASGLNQKYGIGNKINNFAASSASPPPPQSPTQGGIGKKPPPPPPPKKRELNASSPGEPPPIPLSSKPRF